MARVNPNTYVTPETTENARKMSYIRLQDACRLWGVHYNEMRLEALRGNLEGCVKVGKFWYIRPATMDRLLGQRGVRCQIH